MNTDTLTILGIAAVAMLVTGWLAYAVVLSWRRRNLRKQFGPEYDYAVDHASNRLTAEEELVERGKRVGGFDLRVLDSGERERYRKAWYDIQARFVDDPSEAVEGANRLIKEAMAARGFPVADFEQRAADLSVMYPEFVMNYRSAHAIAMKNRQNRSSTEELRQAMIHYHAMFDTLLGQVEAGDELDSETRKEMEPAAD